MASHFKRLVFVSTVLGIGLFLFVTLYRPMKPNVFIKQDITVHMSSGEITCNTEDYEDTDVIRSWKKKDEILIPNSERLETLFREELAYLYHRYIENVQYRCKRKIRLGSIEDGGWDICDEEKLRPQRNKSTSSCLVYSFGINNDFSFDEAIRDYYGCDVHCFDPSMNQDDFDRGKIHFHNLGISSRDEVTRDGWKLLRYNSIRSQLGHTKDIISILKIDVEMYEWSVLPDILDTADLRGTNNIALEFHLELSSPEQNRERYLSALKLLRKLYEAGYRIFWTHQNKWCKFLSKCKKELRTNCHEVNFVKSE
ncbi:hypothetical protein ACF0H5_001452 [Mactra antiquata]